LSSSVLFFFVVETDPHLGTCPCARPEENCQVTPLKSSQYCHG
jgi:hypothetical protein